MWGASRYLYFPESPKASSLSSSDRKPRKNHTSKLHELALLLPLAPKTSSKKLTKKEILQYILHYIQYLQRNIDVAKALLKFHTVNGEDGAGGLGRNSTVGSARQRHVTPSNCPHSCQSCLGGACRTPRKKKLTRASERQTRAQNPCCCLALDKPKKQVTPPPDQKGGNVEGTSTPPRCCIVFALSTLYLFAIIIFIVIIPRKNNVQDDGPYPAFGAQQGAERTYFLYRTQPYPRYKLVFYDSSEEMDKEAPDTDPWLPAWTPEGSPHGSPLALEPPQIDNWSVMGQPSEILGLSPSLFSSPGKLLPEQVLEDGSEYLTQALFEEVFLDPVSSPSACVLEVPLKKDTPPGAPEDLSDSHSLCLSSASLDHLSLSEDSQASSSSEGLDTDMDTELVWRQQEEGQERRGRQAPREAQEQESLLPHAAKKKCVNGFIMFCRMNRKQYIRACPGTASTTATKQLAQLWREMTEQERRPYSIKARRFSRQHNRIVKQESSSSEDEDWGVPKPFYQLLADRARCSSQPASQPSSCHR
ncbi:hypothetical protein QTO34_010250 [Cnephaeus nilssonii]|uniref:Basic helix-loop-helix and HMG box domain-containing protein 1 n=1 Tax=Cnephaeus nilssonii TaxID=3371016 RepID=A0AA40HFY6_CNENI|nr:hypothetical protein QTO34_010250 [Eptesicus nilssonii]